MKVLIIYASRNGASRQACEMLSDAFGRNCSVTLLDINSALPSPKDFDVAIVGGSVRFGKLDKKLKKYMKENAAILSSMPSAAFICCGLLKDFDDYKTMQIPGRVSFSLGVHCFGGQLKPDRCKGVDKILVKIMRESILTQDPDKSEDILHDLPELMPDTILALAQTVNKIN